MSRTVSIPRWKLWSFIFLLGACLTAGNVQAQVSSPTFKDNTIDKAERKLTPDQQKTLAAKKLAYEKIKAEAAKKNADGSLKPEIKKASPEAIKAKEKAFIEQMRAEGGEDGARKAQIILDMKAGKDMSGVLPISSNAKKTPIINTPSLRTVTDYPYTESFEGTDGDWVANGSNISWERGVPAGATINTAPDGTEVWVTNLDGNYNNNEESWVESPTFDFSTLLEPKLSFDFKYNIESNWDGAVLQYSTDDGTTWANLGDLTTGGNWYNDELFAFSGALDFTGSGSLDCWTGVSAGAGYLTAEFPLTFLAGESTVVFRFVLGTDASAPREGFAFDNVKISDPQDDLLVSAFLSNDFIVASNAASVAVEISNAGKVPASNFDIVLEVDGTVVATETFTGSLNNGDAVDYTFTTPIDLSASTLTEFALTAYTVYADDDDASNDSLSTTVSAQILVNSFPYNQGFEDGNQGSWGVGSNGAVASTWEVGIPQGPDVIGVTDGFNAWTTNLDGDYAVDEQSWVYSPVFDFTNNLRPLLAFDIAYSLEPGFDGVAFQYSTDLGQTWTNLGAAGDAGNWYDGNIDDAFFGNALAFSGGNGDAWTGNSFTYKRASRGVDELAGESSVMFRFVLGSDDFCCTQDGFAFDNVEVSEVGFDVEVVSIDMPTYGAYTANTPIVATLRNLGAETISNFDFAYVVDGGVAVTEVVPNSIAFGETFQYTFSTTADLATLGSHTVAVRTALANDFDATNDFVNKNIATLAYVNTFPYTESFEGTDGGWFAFTENANGFVSWEHGEPDNTFIDAASDGTEAWVTSLTGNYLADEESYLISPIFDFGTFDPVLIADIYREIETNFDGVAVQYSFDGGENWSNIGAEGDPNNWYNGNIDGFFGNPMAFSGGNGDAWTGFSFGYEEVGRFLPEGKGNQMIMRFVLGSDFIFTEEGFALDNVRFIDRSTITSFVNCDTIFVNTDPGLATATVSAPSPALNNATGSEVVVNDITGTDDASGTYDYGATTITWTLTVPGGFTEVCQQIVIVNDIELPVIADCPEDILLLVPIGTVDTVVTFSPPSGATDNVGFAKTYTYSNNQNVIPLFGLACPTGVNSAIRVFDLNDFGITNEAKISRVEFGVGESNAVQSATVNLYSYDPNDPLAFANLDFLGTTDVAIPTGAAFFVEAPINATVPAGMSLVMEVFYTTGGNNLRIGTQLDGSVGESYISSSTCGLPGIDNVKDVGAGFPQNQWVMNFDVENSLELLYTLESGESFPLGVTNQAYGIEDAAGNQALCEFNVVVLSEIQALEATNVSNSGFTANWTESLGAEEYLLDISNSSNFSAAGLVASNVSVKGLPSYDFFTRLPNESKVFYYRVRAKYGSLITPYSNTIRVILLPPTPVALPATDITSTRFNANWNNLTEQASWMAIELSTDGFITSTTVRSNAGVSNITKVIDNVSQNRYQYRLRTAWDFGQLFADTTYSPYSNVITVSPKPMAPSDLVATASLVGATPSVQLDWTVNTTDAASFQWIERSVAGTGNWLPLFSAPGAPVMLPINVNSYVDNTAQEFVRYAYRVVAIVPDYSAPTNPALFIRSESNIAVSDLVSSTIDELLDGSTVISPNPSKGDFRITMDNSYNGELSFQVYDITGKLIASESIRKNASSFERVIDLTNQQAGMFMLKITSDNGFVTRRLVKQ